MATGAKQRRLDLFVCPVVSNDQNAKGITLIMKQKKLGCFLQVSITSLLARL